VLRDGEVVGYLTSGAFAHTFGSSIGLGYVPCRHAGETVKEQLASNYIIEVASKQFTAKASLKPFYDAKGEKTKL
jgi:4-methylaminobutanoate oxidase (formaldehyde-forming)